MQPPPESPQTPQTPSTKRHAFRGAIVPICLAALSGVLFALALPPHNVEWVGWFAFVPLLIVTRLPGATSSRMLYRFCLGLWSGLVCAVTQVGWVTARVNDLQFAYLPYVWIAIVIGLVVGFGTPENDAHNGDAKAGLRRVLGIACAGVAVEWLTTFSPLPVGIALCQHRTLPIIQIAEVTGIWGVSALLWFVNAALADALLRRRFATPLWIAGGLLFYTLAQGEYALFMHAELSSPSAVVAAIQDYSPGDGAGFGTTIADPTSQPEKEDLIRDAARRGAKLIVGSEEAWGSGFHPDDPKDVAVNLARGSKSSLVVGFSQERPGAADGKSWNCAALVGPDGATVGIHHKIRLFLGERQNVLPGNSAHAFDSPIGRVGLMICFDSCYTDAARQATADGAKIIAMPNFDPPTPRAVLHELHAALIPFRAVENRVAFVRADPNGKSQIVDPIGRIVAESPMRVPEALVAPVRLGDGKGTLFTRWGDWFAYLCVGVTLTFALWGRRFGKRAIAPK